MKEPARGVLDRFEGGLLSSKDKAIFDAKTIYSIDDLVQVVRDLAEAWGTNGPLRHCKERPPQSYG
jgi:hypothetical protein